VPASLRDATDPARAVLAHYLREAFSLQIEAGEVCATLTYGIANRRISLTVLSGAVVKGRVRCREHACARWVGPDELAQLALPAPHRKVLSQALT